MPPSWRLVSELAEWAALFFKKMPLGAGGNFFEKKIHPTATNMEAAVGALQTHFLTAEADLNFVSRKLDTEFDLKYNSIATEHVRPRTGNHAKRSLPGCS